jgi:hypothetical protein
LYFGHAASAAQRAIGEVPEEARIGLDEQVMLEGEELAVFEGFEAVENEGSAGKDLGTHVSMEEETVPPEPANRPIDGRRRDP